MCLTWISTWALLSWQDCFTHRWERVRWYKICVLLFIASAKQLNFLVNGVNEMIINQATVSRPAQKIRATKWWHNAHLSRFCQSRKFALKYIYSNKTQGYNKVHFSTTYWLHWNLETTGCKCRNYRSRHVNTYSLCSNKNVASLSNGLISQRCSGTSKT